MSVVVAASQAKREVCIALFNRELHKNNRCPGNYDVDYRHGWFYWQYGATEEQHAQRPELTAEADEIIRTGSHTVMYSPNWNTYVLVPTEHHEEDDE